MTDGAAVNLSLVKLPNDAPDRPFFGEDIIRPRDARSLANEFGSRAKKLGFQILRFHDLRDTRETLLLDTSVPVHVVAARCGHDPAILLRTYARRTKKVGTSAAAVIGPRV